MRCDGVFAMVVRPGRAFRLGMAGPTLLALLVGHILPASSQVAAGRLVCRLGAGPGVVVGAYRDATCSFERPHGVTERYEGYTGIVTAPVGDAQSVVFAVDMPQPNALAALGGDYAGRGFGRYGSSAALVGGIGGAVVLTPLNSSATTSLAPLNGALGVSQLHLNYAGRARTSH